MDSASRIPSKLRPPQSVAVKRHVQKENIPLGNKRGRYELTSSNGSNLSQIHRSNSVLSLNKVGKNSLPATAGKNFTGRLTNIPSVSKDEKIQKNKVTKQKRPAWDLKGRIQDMEEEFVRSRRSNQQLHDQLELTNERVAFLEQINTRLNEDVASKTAQSEEASQIVENLKSTLKEKDEELNKISNKLKEEIEELKTIKLKLENKLKSLEEELNNSQNESRSLRNTVIELTTSQVGLNAQLEVSKSLLNEEKEKTKIAQEEIEYLHKILQDQNNHIASLEVKIREDEMTRRIMHNAIQELKGNIRVFCRVRPLLNAEKHFGMEHISFPDSDQHSIELIRNTNINLSESLVHGKTKPGIKIKFTFDRIFKPSSSQTEIFDEVSQLIQSVLDGYNVCIFAYGQTGSGKTYTMEGPEDIIDFNIESENELGIIPRTIHQIFNSVQDLKEKGWKYELEASFLEIYNETIKDLLSIHTDNKCEIKALGSKGKDIHVTNLTLVKVTSEEVIETLLKRAHKNRSVASTQCNEHSSRSHSVFRLKLNGYNEITKEECEGMLNLVDLAGSERLKESHSEGNRLLETKNINKSLSNLGNVIMALAQKADYIPYRNSKLTHLLMNSLGGNSKTLMFVNVSPLEDHINETINSLRFATKVNQCQIGTAQKSVK
ncbi:carboxy-terminal kinesin 2-like [Centruroides vittatus]|uniref:carboxy-terminal kinesin 2-like n=1 Tax=Centruroides vittatus TaxID=120091 RepID=UPI00350F1A4B